jgi:hypothetical protein
MSHSGTAPKDLRDHPRREFRDQFLFADFFF